jgi:hypothetical protein
MATTRNNNTSVAQSPSGLTKPQQVTTAFALKQMGLSPKQIQAAQNKIAGTTAIGLNRATTAFVKIVKNVDKAASKVMNGVPQDPNAKFINPLKYGLIPITELIASIDLCNIINYLINQVPDGKPFNPNNTEQQKTVLGRKKFQLQYAAFRIQGYIDGYYSVGSDITNSKDPENISKTRELIIKIVQEFNDLQEATDNIFNNPELNNAFPQLSTYTNFMTGASVFFNQYTDVRSLPVGTDYKKILNYIDKTRSTCVLIQGLNNPTNLVAFADTFLGGSIAEQIQKLQKLIDPKKILNVVKDIQNGVVKFTNIVKQILGVVNIIRTIISIANVLIKVFYVIIAFFLGMPLPTMFTTTGVTTFLSKSENKLAEQVKFFADRLAEINRIMSSIYFFCTRRILELQQIQSNLTAVQINLQNCDLSTPEIKQNVEDSIKLTNAAVNNLDKFVKTYDNNLEKKKKRTGEYTIQILTEEVVDEGISIRRRYGVALDKNQIVIAKSVPTFASNDDVIIEEVKLLLPKKKSTNIIPQEDLNLIDESLNYLDTDEPLDGSFDVPIEDEPEEDTDSEDDDPADGLGLQGFINKLKGGKKLRRRMRREMAKSKRKLSNQVARTDPQSPKSKRAELSALRAELDVLNDDLAAAKNKLKVTIAASVLNPSLRPVVIILAKNVRDIEKLIKEKQDKINALEKSTP